MLDLGPIRERVEKATAGDRFVEVQETIGGTLADVFAVVDGIPFCAASFGSERAEADAQLFAHAPDDIRALCLVACTACGKCVMDAAPGLISVESGVAVIEYSKNELADAKAIARCPTDAIVWVEGAQAFGRHAAMAGSTAT